MCINIFKLFAAINSLGDNIDLLLILTSRLISSDSYSESMIRQTTLECNDKDAIFMSTFYNQRL
jgi:hypothetical protein